MPVDFTKIIEPLRHGLIVSCQAPANSPLYEPSIIAAIAQASINQGAVAIESIPLNTFKRSNNAAMPP